MGSTRSSGSVRAGYVIVTILLILTLAFGVVSLASIVAGLVRDGESLLYGDRLMVPAQISAEDLGALPDGLRLQSWPSVTLEITDPTTQQMLLRSALDLGSLVLIAVGLWLLQRFMGAVVAGVPFGPANVRRLRTIGSLLVVGAPIVGFLNHSLRAALLDVLPPYPSVELGMEGLSIPGNYLLAGLAAFILAEVFASGLQLREDVEATI
jgi:hypothetical protein